ncbi:MAG: type II toxin-antitoxin system RelE/ParE family toxin [Opitutaceae bacterium]|nr:type II toxin-antitoxin system RelE/ParE family toxin [Opitutaceae bacterium]
MFDSFGSGFAELQNGEAVSQNEFPKDFREASEVIFGKSKYLRLTEIKKAASVWGMIISFADETTMLLFRKTIPKGFRKDVVKQAGKRLDYLNAATKIEHMYFPASNKFHALNGFNPTRYSIWVNDKWRITFEWTEAGATNVQFEDYH